jgi:uncharacterized membrane protein/thiol-disulfide isomerase/thioredoxin
MRRKHKDNLLQIMLGHLGVKYTTGYSEALYEQHPYKHTLFGISKMLSGYAIDNAGLRLNNKEEIHRLPLPFIAQLHDDLAVVYKINDNYISYQQYENRITVSKDDFFNGWSGVVLLTDKTETSAEPEYAQNKRKELFKLVEKITLFFAIVVLMIVGYLSHDLFSHVGVNILLAVNLTGIYVGYLLFLKQMSIQSSHADKICSLFKKRSNCNNILESPAAKFAGIIGWSEVGLGYFISNTILIIFFPPLIPWLALINICALPYTAWSVWYQKFRVRIWCPLCLIVQVLLWAVFVTGLSFDFIRRPEWVANDILITACIYAVPFLVVSLLAPVISTGRKTQQLYREINSFRLKNEVFLSELKQQPYKEISSNFSCITFGNPAAELKLTVLTNPFCNPCARMHPRIERVLKNCNNNIHVQYVLTYFFNTKEMTRQLMSVYVRNEPNEANRILSEWFESTKSNYKAFFELYGANAEDPAAVEEFGKHERWHKESGFNATPTLLVNGYKLPKNYKVEDLVYFTDLFSGKS